MNLIMLDPGHGGSANGAVAEGVKEKDINLAVALEVAHILSSSWSQYVPILTRYKDVSMTLNDRCQFEHGYRPRCFVSIHCNSFSDSAVKGFEVFTTKGETRADLLATKVFEEVQKSFPGLTTRTDFSDGDPDKEENFAVLRGTSCPAILVECGFMSNSQELSMLMSPLFVSRIAAAISYGITRWVVAEEGAA